MAEEPIEVPVDRIVEAAMRMRKTAARPIVIALDGGVGAGKAALAAQILARIPVSLFSLKDFYPTTVPEAEWLNLTVQERFDHAIDWMRVRRLALEPLRAGRRATWKAVDFKGGLTRCGTYDLASRAKVVKPAPIILMEGAYAGSSRLRDLVDLAVIVNVSARIRHHRLVWRSGQGSAWVQRWSSVWAEVERFYLERVRPPNTFDVRIDAAEMRQQLGLRRNG